MESEILIVCQCQLTQIWHLLMKSKSMKSRKSLKRFSIDIPFLLTDFVWNFSIFCESFCGVYSLVSCSILLLWFYSFNTNIFIIYCIFINIQLMMNDVWVRMILFFKFIFFVRLFSLALDWTVHLKNKNLLIAFNHDEEKLVIFTEKYSFVGFPWMPTSFCRRLCFHSYILLYLLHFIELYTFSSSDSETRIDDDGGYA